MSGKWVDYAAQSVIHALVAAVAIEALLKLWRARAPGDRLVLRLLGLGQPLLVTPALFLLAPQRGGEEFHDRWALFAARHWDDVRVAGASVLHLGVAAGVALGLGLFLMDLLPLLPGRRRALPRSAAAPADLAGALAEVAAARGIRPPVLHFLESRAIALFCARVRSPVLVVSRGTLDLLDPDELRAALGHELGHIEHRDPALSWALMAIRAALCFNPIAQVVARALARDAEWRADERAGSDRLSLASALVKLHRFGLGRPGPARRTLPFAAALAEPLRRVRSHDVEARCRRLLEPSAPPRLAFRPVRVALAMASLAGLSFLVA
jgi:Zn-dependent protease with chaperone function